MDEHPAAKTELAGAGEGLKSLVKTLKALFFCLRILIAVIFVCLLFSGVFYVDEQQEAMLFRFGELQRLVVDDAGTESAILRSGRWYWAWPYPVDSKVFVPAQRSVQLDTGTFFWPRDDAGLMSPDAAARAAANQPLVPGQAGYLLTGDTNIMHAVWSVTYRITDASKYYLGFYDDSEAENLDDPGARERGAEAIIRNVLANAALAETGTWAVEDVLVTSRPVDEGSEERESLESRVRARVVAKLDELDMGVDVQHVNIVDNRPPLATMQAFRQVVESAQVRRRLIDEARAYAERVTTEADGAAARIRSEAEAYETRVVESVRAQSAYFQTVLEEYRQNPQTMLVALYADTIRDVLQEVETKYIVHASDSGRQEIRLLLGPEPENPGEANPDDSAQ